MRALIRYLALMSVLFGLAALFFLVRFEGRTLYARAFGHRSAYDVARSHLAEWGKTLSDLWDERAAPAKRPTPGPSKKVEAERPTPPKTKRDRDVEHLRKVAAAQKKPSASPPVAIRKRTTVDERPDAARLGVERILRERGDRAVGSSPR